jgi:hypothetical protein
VHERTGPAADWNGAGIRSLLRITMAPLTNCLKLVAIP